MINKRSSSTKKLNKQVEFELKTTRKNEVINPSFE